MDQAKQLVIDYRNEQVRKLIATCEAGVVEAERINAPEDIKAKFREQLRLAEQLKMM